jgi:hypothetical protein
VSKRFSFQVRYAGGNREVLIDVNAHDAAANLQLSFDRWDVENSPQPQAQSFLAWAKVMNDSVDFFFS